jgi:xanthine dehydrogenase iron-sulfur cluster and FAD-binding subunit A
MILSARALLDENPRPTRAEIRAALSGNLCRCTGYTQIVQAIELCIAEACGAEPEPPAWSSGTNPWRAAPPKTAPPPAGPR